MPDDVGARGTRDLRVGLTDIDFPFPGMVCTYISNSAQLRPLYIPCRYIMKTGIF